MAEQNMPPAPPQPLREEALDEVIRFVVVVGYLWVVFVLLPVHKSIALSECHLDFFEFSFAIVNLVVFARVLLSCKVFHLRMRVSGLPSRKVHPLRQPSEEESVAAFTRSELKDGVTIPVRAG